MKLILSAVLQCFGGLPFRTFISAFRKTCSYIGLFPTIPCEVAERGTRFGSLPVFKSYETLTPEKTEFLRDQHQS